MVLQEVDVVPDTAFYWPVVVYPYQINCSCKSKRDGDSGGGLGQLLPPCGFAVSNHADVTALPCHLTILTFDFLFSVL